MDLKNRRRENGGEKRGKMRAIREKENRWTRGS